MAHHETENDWRTDSQAAGIAQARALRDQARKGGLRFEAYLPPDLAEWVLAHIERGDFVDPGEAVFIILGEHKDLEPHADIRQELLKRIIEAATNDPRPPLSSEELEKWFEELRAKPQPIPAIWRRDRESSLETSEAVS